MKSIIKIVDVFIVINNATVFLFMQQKKKKKEKKEYKKEVKDSFHKNFRRKRVTELKKRGGGIICLYTS